MFNEDRPKIVCLCGSTRFKEAFEQANIEETLAGNIVLSVGSMTQSDPKLMELVTPEIKLKLDCLHLEKIKLADEILILNVGGYVGESTFNEFLFAYGLGKGIRFLEPHNVPEKCLVVLHQSKHIEEQVYQPIPESKRLRKNQELIGLLKTWREENEGGNE